MSPNRIPLESSTLASVLYDSSHRHLQVEFRSGDIYLYSEVPLQTYHELLKAPSKGAYFNRNIRKRFVCQQLRHLQPATTGVI